MPMAPVPRQDDPVTLAIRAVVGADDRPLVLAVSGGMDSMVLLDAAARVAPGLVAAVATFDHRSGTHGAAAVNLVRREASLRGLRVIAGRAESPLDGEAAWRAARWTFLRNAARQAGGEIATAHSRDDQLETVCLRVLRGSAARGLAGLYALSPIRRPFIELSRADIERYARSRGVAYADDPTNRSMCYLRNRLRRDLLPAIARVDHEFEAAMLALARDAAELRRAVDGVVDTLVRHPLPGEVEVELAVLRALDSASVRLLAPAIAARVGIVLDRRGTTRLSAFILNGRGGGRVQLSGGGEAELTRQSIIVRRERPTLPGDEQPLDAMRVTAGWHFRRVERVTEDDAWMAALPAEKRLTVRPWRAGDRMRAVGGSSARRVKRFLSDAGIAGPGRTGWPVVLADGEIVWIPGVRRSDAATDRSGRPVLRYLCERNDV
jgi:tRNA(Ile)-lysidine synthase